MEPGNVTAEQAGEIEEQRSGKGTTLRPSAPLLEEMLYTPVPVLDRGFVRCVDYMGNDDAIVQAARVSYGRGTRKAQDDANLVRYLMRHQHTTPFEMCEIKFHVKLPVFVARQWIRHRTASVNEYSARYSILDREFYLPDPAHLAAQATSNNQGRGELVEGEEAIRATELLEEGAKRAYGEYEEMLNLRDGETIDSSRRGLAREIARSHLPISVYTQWYWKIDLHNLLHFLDLRGDPHAQYEIRAYAEAIEGFVQRWVPTAWQAFLDYRRNASRFSSAQTAALRRMLKGETVERSDTGMSAREWREFEEMIGGASQP